MLVQTINRHLLARPRATIQTHLRKRPSSPEGATGEHVLRAVHTMKLATRYASSTFMPPVRVALKKFAANFEKRRASLRLLDRH